MKTKKLNNLFIQLDPRKFKPSKIDRNDKIVLFDRVKSKDTGLWMNQAIWKSGRVTFEVAPQYSITGKAAKALTHLLTK